MTIRLLAVVDGRARVPGVRFLAVPGASFWCATGPGAAVVGVEELRAQDALVRRLHAKLDAVVPARFGDTYDDDDALIDAVAARHTELDAALALVKGREQMTLRLRGHLATPPPSPPVASPGVADDARPGTRFLAQKRALAAAARWPRLDPLRAALGDLVVDERIDGPALYHLIPRGCSDRYRVVVERHRDLLGEARVSGPFPCHAFAPGAVR